MTTFDLQPLRAENATALAPALAEHAKMHREQLAGTPFPTRKTESWKYSAKRLVGLDSLPLLSTSEVQSTPEYELDCDTIEIVNGRLPESLPELSGIQFKTFSELSGDEAHAVTRGLSTQASDLPFAALNSAAMQSGLFIRIAAGQDINKPLRLLITHNGHGLSFPRVFVQVERAASVTLIEELHVSNSDSSAAWSNSLVDMDIADGAALTYLRMNVDDGEQMHIGATGVTMHRDARFSSHCLSLGSQLGRHDLRVLMTEPGGECNLNGICVTKNRQHFDNHTSIDHAAPHCTSNENYRCIADDASQIVFNGRIHIHPHAQKTLGEMSNKNLLLSASAEIDTKPELEIYADDVKCAHGSTIGQLDHKELYYLKTRGIPEDQAKQILTLGFVLERVHAVPLENIAAYWEQKLTGLLSFNDSVMTTK